MNILEGKRNKLEFDAPLKWQSVKLMKCIHWRPRLCNKVSLSWAHAQVMISVPQVWHDDFFEMLQTSLSRQPHFNNIVVSSTVLQPNTKHKNCIIFYSTCFLCNSLYFNNDQTDTQNCDRVNLQLASFYMAPGLHSSRGLVSFVQSICPVQQTIHTLCWHANNNNSLH